MNGIKGEENNEVLERTFELIGILESQIKNLPNLTMNSLIQESYYQVSQKSDQNAKKFVDLSRTVDDSLKSSKTISLSNQFRDLARDSKNKEAQTFNNRYRYCLEEIEDSYTIYSSKIANIYKKSNQQQRNSEYLNPKKDSDICPRLEKLP